MTRPAAIFMTVALLAGTAAPGQTTLPAINVQQVGPEWIISGQRRRITFRPGDFTVNVQTGETTWRMHPSAPDDLTVQSAGKVSSFRFTDAASIDVRPWHTGFASGLKVSLAGFRRDAIPLDLELRLLLTLEANSEDLLCELIAVEKGTCVRECLWPKGFEEAGVDATVVPFMQGMLLPGNWPRKVNLYDWLSYSRALYMPWWGQIRGSSAAMVILETPCDGGCRFSHPAGGPTSIQTRWVHSLGRMSYPRRVRICFLEGASHVELAKRYRRHALEAGQFVSLRQKIARSPLVSRLLGTPVLHSFILYHIQPQSSYFSKDDPAKNHQLVRFDTRAEELRKLAGRGVGRLYLHLDGWGARGYDNLHPDILPPCPEAGGYPGMKHLADVCDQLGYIFAVHDNYRDYYHDAACYDENLTILDETGNRFFGHQWFGGNQSILCSRFAPGYVSRNHRALLEAGIRLRGAYLDVFSVVPGDECYHPEHPVTRSQSLEFRARCFDLIRTLEGLVSSEEPCDWAIPHIDLVHHAPYALDPDPGGGTAMGVPIPLFNLVYHDALLTPWVLSRGGWGIPSGDLAYLHGLLNAGMPYISIDFSDQEMRRVRTMCALHRRVGLLEMTRHVFLDRNYRKQRAVFADGTTVTIDLDTDTFEVHPPLTEEEIASALRP